MVFFQNYVGWKVKVSSIKEQNVSNNLTNQFRCSRRCVTQAIFYRLSVQCKDTEFSLIFFSFLAIHCVKSVRIRSYSGPHFSRIRTEYGEILRISPYSVRMRENAGKRQTRITPNTDTFYAVIPSLFLCFFNPIQDGGSKVLNCST